MKLKPKSVHPKGEEQKTSNDSDNHQIEVDTYAGKVFVEWDSNAAVTPLAQLPFFIEFLKVGGRFTPWVDDCPLTYLSPNAPRKRNVLGSLFLSILSGYHRYAHMANLLSDRANPKLLEMSKVVSADSARRGLKTIDESEGAQWLQTHLHDSYEPFLRYPWIMDVDVTVKPLYG